MTGQQDDRLRGATSTGAGHDRVPRDGRDKLRRRAMTGRRHAVVGGGAATTGRSHDVVGGGAAMASRRHDVVGGGGR